VLWFLGASLWPILSRGQSGQILADRWTVLIVRELLADIPHFNELERGLPGVSRSLLAERSRRLVQYGVLERRSAGRGKRTEYRLTPAGRELQVMIDVLGEWGARWAFGDPRPNELDPIILLWWMRRRVCFDRISRRRIVIQFEFRGAPRRRYWLLIKPSEASFCLQHPGFDIDVTVTADTAASYRVWLGRSTLFEALRVGQVHLDGSPADLCAFPNWFAWSPMSDKMHEAGARRPTAPGQLASQSNETTSVKIV
jgi:DNA-binding HxlR family transcriptional regulator